MITLLLITTLFINSTSNNIMNNQKKYLALGDSYTIGESVPNNKSFPKQLQEACIKNGINISAVDIIAKTGWTTDQLNEAINKTTPSNNYDLVTLLIGVNNQYRGRDTASYRREFKDLLERAIGFTHSKNNVIVISIPDWGVTPFAEKHKRNSQKIRDEINNYNKINLAESAKRNIKYVDVTEISRQANTDNSLLAADGLHPSEKMYSLWVERLLPFAEEILTDINEK